MPAIRSDAQPHVMSLGSATQSRALRASAASTAATARVEAEIRNNDSSATLVSGSIDAIVTGVLATR